MGWGILGGLGQGLQQVGNTWMNAHLEKEKEKRLREYQQQLIANDREYERTLIEDERGYRKGLLDSDRKYEEGVRKEQQDLRQQELASRRAMDLQDRQWERDNAPRGIDPVVQERLDSVQSELASLRGIEPYDRTEDDTQRMQELQSEVDNLFASLGYNASSRRDDYVVGESYVDGDGNSAIYRGDGVWDDGSSAQTTPETTPAQGLLTGADTETVSTDSINERQVDEIRRQTIGFKSGQSIRFGVDKMGNIVSGNVNRLKTMGALFLTGPVAGVGNFFNGVFHGEN